MIFAFMDDAPASCRTEMAQPRCVRIGYWCRPAADKQTFNSSSTWAGQLRETRTASQTWSSLPLRADPHRGIRPSHRHPGGIRRAGLPAYVGLARENRRRFATADDETELARMGRDYKDRKPSKSFVKIRKVLAANVRSLRDELGLTQAELVVKAELMRQPLLSEIERNSDAVNPTLEMLCRLADGLDVDVVELLTEAKKK